MRTGRAHPSVAQMLERCRRLWSSLVRRASTRFPCGVAYPSGSGAHCGRLHRRGARSAARTSTTRGIACRRPRTCVSYSMCARSVLRAPRKCRRGAHLRWAGPGTSSERRKRSQVASGSSASRSRLQSTEIADTFAPRSRAGNAVLVLRRPCSVLAVNQITSGARGRESGPSSARAECEGTTSRLRCIAAMHSLVVACSSCRTQGPGRALPLAPMRLHRVCRRRFSDWPASSASPHSKRGLPRGCVSKTQTSL